jgi:PelA/Pel-15E family pectate lyase
MKRGIRLLAAIACMSAFAGQIHAEPADSRILDAMRNATEFMVDTVSVNGGYVWIVSDDLSESWGEAPARPKQIWVHNGTVDVGMMLIDAYMSTGDRYYLECAEKAANALIYGQHPLGGWHYVVDFDLPNIRTWYHDVASKYMWGMEEYRHYYGNCTFDDDTTQGATRFLLALYMADLNPVYREPLIRALDFILMSQYPSGGWPQRYPLMYDYVHDGFKDYSSYYTLNDSAMLTIMDVLIDAYEQLGNEAYLDAAKRCADFLIAVQGPEGQGGWADQYGMDMKPAWARTHEPAGFMPRYTLHVIQRLEKFFLMTGDYRYLAPIPAAIDWMDASALTDLGNGRKKVGEKYEYGTNRLIVQNATDSTYEDGYGIRETTYIDLDDDKRPGGSREINIAGLKANYDRLSELSPEQAKREYRRTYLTDRPHTVDPENVERIISALDSRGAWVADVRVWDWDLVRVVDRVAKTDRQKTVRGISTRSFVDNMYQLIHSLGTAK